MSYSVLNFREFILKDFWASLAVGAVIGLVALAAMRASADAIPAIVAIALGVLGSIAVSVFRLGPGIRHLTTGMQRDRVEIAKATEELRKLMSRIREPNDVEIEMYGRGGQRLVWPIEEREKRSRLGREP